MIARIRDSITDFLDGLDTRRAVGIGVGIILIIGAVVFIVTSPEPQPEATSTVSLTADAVQLATQIGAQATATQFASTPQILELTAAAPTLSLAGRREVQQYAASAFDTSGRQDLAYNAVQAAGPPNVEGCTQSEQGWAPLTNNSRITLTLFYTELVTPTRIIVYQPFNPGFITQMSITDRFNQEQVVYTAPPAANPTCPGILDVAVPRQDLVGATVNITVDQTGNTGGPTQIDAVQLIGIQFQ